jgi:hypothetical protein
MYLLVAFHLMKHQSMVMNNLKMFLSGMETYNRISRTEIQTTSVRLQHISVVLCENRGPTELSSNVQ